MSVSVSRGQESILPQSCRLALITAVWSSFWDTWQKKKKEKKELLIFDSSAWQTRGLFHWKYLLYMSPLSCLRKGGNRGEERGSTFTLLSVPSSKPGVKFHLAYFLKFGLSSTHKDTQCIQEAEFNRVPLASTHAYTKEEMGHYPTLSLLNFGYHCCEDNIYPHLTSFKLLHCFQGTVWGHRNKTQAKQNLTYHSQTANK